MDPEPERSVDVVDDDRSLSSYKPEQLLSEASDASLPSRRRHWMDTRLRTKLRAGGSRPHYQQFDYSTSGTDDELSDAMLPMPPNPVDEDLVEPAAPPAALDPSISPPVYYLNCSLTMSACAHRLHRYPPPKKKHRCLEPRHPC